MAMHPHFPHWYRRVEMNATTDAITKRWDAAAAFVKSPDADEILLLLRLFCWPSSSQTDAARLSQFLIQKDDSFPPDQNSELVRAMAGAAILSLLHQSEGGPAAVAVARAIQTTNFPDLKADLAIPEVRGVAAEFLSTNADKVRPDNFTNFLPADESLKTKVDAVKDAKPETFAVLAFDAFNAFRALQRNWSKAVSDRILRLSEETQTCWWLITGYSHCLARPFKDCTAIGLALVAALELADRTKAMPAPDSFRHILRTALKAASGDANELAPLRDFVVAIPKTSRPNEDTYFVGDICRFAPISTALAKFDEVSEEGTWTATLSKASPMVSSATKVSPETAAWQFFQELEFRRALHAI